MKGFEELDAWKLARIYKSKIAELTKRFPKHEEYELKRQIIRPSRSVQANIAEGFGRFHYQENIQFCRQARGSLTETHNHVFEALDCCYIDENIFNDLKEDFQRCLHVLKGYIAYLKIAKEESERK
jgi:four helix bundle protein